MPALTFAEMFGSQAVSNIDTNNDSYQIILDLRSFQDDYSGGDFTNNLGIKNLPAKAEYYQQGAEQISSEAQFTNLIYALLLLISQNQATNKNDDPEQDIYIQPTGVSVITSGSRQGQVERRFTVSFFSFDGVNNVAAIDAV